MARVIAGCILLWLLSPFCRAEDLNAEATGETRAETERNPGSADSVEELLRHADHLQRSGLNEEAGRVRADARKAALHDNLLVRKETELANLQAEVDRIRNLTGNPQTVLVKLTAIEIKRSKLGDKAEVLDRMFGLRRESEARQGEDDKQATTDGSAARFHFDLKSPLFQELGRRQALAVIAEPTLITTSGRRASFLSGGQFAVPTGHKALDGTPAVKWESFGVHLDVVPNVLAEGRIRLQAAFKVSEKDTHNPINVHGLEIPSLSTRAVNTEIEIRDGETVVLAGLRSTRYPGKPQREVSKTNARTEGVRLTGTNPAGTSSLTGTIALLLEETPADQKPGEGEDYELIVLINAELANRPALLPPKPAGK